LVGCRQEEEGRSESEWMEGMCDAVSEKGREVQRIDKIFNHEELKDVDDDCEPRSVYCSRMITLIHLIEDEIVVVKKAFQTYVVVHSLWRKSNRVAEFLSLAVVCPVSELTETICIQAETRA
jgi:hypothetical protein